MPFVPENISTECEIIIAAVCIIMTWDGDGHPNRQCHFQGHSNRILQKKKKGLFRDILVNFCFTFDEWSWSQLSWWLVSRVSLVWSHMLQCDVKCTVKTWSQFWCGVKCLGLNCIDKCWSWFWSWFQWVQVASVSFFPWSDVECSWSHFCLWTEMSQKGMVFSFQEFHLCAPGIAVGGSVAWVWMSAQCATQTLAPCSSLLPSSLAHQWIHFGSWKGTNSSKIQKVLGQGCIHFQELCLASVTLMHLICCATTNFIWFIQFLCRSNVICNCHCFWFLDFVSLVSKPVMDFLLNESCETA